MSTRITPTPIAPPAPPRPRVSTTPRRLPSQNEMVTVTLSAAAWRSLHGIADLGYASATTQGTYRDGGGMTRILREVWWQGVLGENVQ